MYTVIDLNKSSILWPGRMCATPNLEIRSFAGLPTPLGRIDERRLLINGASRAKGGFHGGTRSVPVGSKNKGNKGILPPSQENEPGGGGAKKGSKEASMTSLPAIDKLLGRLSLVSTGSQGSLGSLQKSNHKLEEVVHESSTHDHFCIAFRSSIDYKMKIVLIGALLLTVSSF